MSGRPTPIVPDGSRNVGSPVTIRNLDGSTATISRRNSYVLTWPDGSRVVCVAEESTDGEIDLRNPALDFGMWAGSEGLANVHVAPLCSLVADIGAVLSDEWVHGRVFPSVLGAVETARLDEIKRLVTKHACQRVNSTTGHPAPDATETP